VLTTAHYDRFTSRGETDFADTILSTMRFQLGDRLLDTDFHFFIARGGLVIVQAHVGVLYRGAHVGPFVDFLLQIRIHVKGSTLLDLDREIQRVLQDSGEYPKGSQVRVFMGFDFDTIPTLLRQYHTHYFNRTVAVDSNHRL